MLAPLTIVIVAWGTSRSFSGRVPDGFESGPIPGVPLVHLWFLYYLCMFYVLLFALRSAFDALIDRHGRARAAIDRAVRLVVASRAAPFVLATPLLAVLYFDDSWPVWTGIPTPDFGLTPKLPAMVGFGTAFAFGWLIHRQTDLSGYWRRAWHVNLAAAVGLTAVCLAIVGPSADVADPYSIAGAAWHRALYAASYTAAIWFWTFGIIGAALRFCSAPSRGWRYLADSSYWLYLAHLPVVFLLQVLIADLPVHWAVKFPLILAIALGVLLTSYHYLVRSTFIGEILNGRKYPRRTPNDPALPEPDGPGGKRDRGAVAELSAVTKRFGSTIALEKLDLEVQPGELLAVLGPNGAGKSTALALWLGMLEPDEGSVRLLGRSPHDVDTRREVGIMMQEVTLSPELKGREIIALTAGYYPNPRPAEEAIALARVDGLAEKRYGRMSTGQKRQVQFAAAVCGRPKLLFLDEPTVGLDVRACEAMWQAIRRLLDDGCSIVLTTHYLEEAEALADRVAVLAKGRLIAIGSVAEMRSLVARKRISCASALSVDDIKAWPGVIDAARNAEALDITAVDAENIVRRLLAADGRLRNLEVKQATLAEAFTELTKEAA